MKDRAVTFQRFVAIGDSFTEGYGDPDPDSPGGLRGWADRTADVLATRTQDFAYANLAIRGRLLGRIVDEQIEPAVALQPDLITISAGGNDVIRPGTDPDAIAARLDPALARLTATGATVVLFTGVDVAFSPVFRRIRGKVAIYNELLRGLAVEARRARRRPVVAEVHPARRLLERRPPAPQRVRPPRGRADGPGRARRAERPRAERPRATAGSARGGRRASRTCTGRAST